MGCSLKVREMGDRGGGEAGITLVASGAPSLRIEHPMYKEMIQGLFASAAVGKVKAADGLGAKTTWSMDDHVKVAAAAIAKAVEMGAKSPEEFTAVVKATYNHSAMAQKLEKLFAGTGHFVRSDKPKNVEDLMAQLVREQMRK